MRDGAVRLTTVRFDRLIEQDKVLLMRREIEMVADLRLRGVCRQAWGTEGKPW